MWMKHMGKYTILNIFSFILSAIILLGGTTVCVLIEFVSHGPLFQDPSVKVLVLVFSSVSFLSTGMVGLLGLVHNDVPWVTNFQISVESVMLIATLTAFLALKDAVYLPGYDECTPSNTTSTCVCSERADVQLPASLATSVECEELYNSRDMAYALIYLYVAVWILCMLELCRALQRACTHSSRLESQQSGELSNNETFYTIPYPELTHKRRKKSEAKSNVDRDKIFTLLST